MKNQKKLYSIFETCEHTGKKECQLVITNHRTRSSSKDGEHYMEEEEKEREEKTKKTLKHVSIKAHLHTYTNITHTHNTNQNK